MWKSWDESQIDKGRSSHTEVNTILFSSTNFNFKYNFTNLLLLAFNMVLAISYMTIKILRMKETIKLSLIWNLMTKSNYTRKNSNLKQRSITKQQGSHQVLHVLEEIVSEKHVIV